MAEKSLITSLKSMEKATSFSTERLARFVNLSCDIVDRRYDLISFILLKERSHDATEMSTESEELFAKVLYAINLIDRMYFSSHFGERSSFSPFWFVVLREMMMSL
jgi:hypothetical protein